MPLPTADQAEPFQTGRLVVNCKPQQRDEVSAFVTVPSFPVLLDMTPLENDDDTPKFVLP